MRIGPVKEFYINDRSSLTQNYFLIDGMDR